MSESIARKVGNENVDIDGAIHVCPLSRVPETVARTGASRLITLLQAEIEMERPSVIAPKHHLRLPVDDIHEPMPYYVAPDVGHVTRLIEFAESWGGQGTLVVHCWAGISRSTAAAFTALCLVNPDVPEEEIARALRVASPTAHPNRLIVRLADEALGRRGRMLRAVEGMSRAVITGEAEPFSLPANQSSA